MRLVCKGVECADYVGAVVPYVAVRRPPFPMWSVCASATILVPFGLLRVLDTGDYAVASVEWFVGGAARLARRLWGELVERAVLMVTGDTVTVKSVSWRKSVSMHRVDMPYFSISLPLDDIKRIAFEEGLKWLRSEPEAARMLDVDVESIDERNVYDVTADLVFRLGVGEGECG